VVQSRRRLSSGYKGGTEKHYEHLRRAGFDWEKTFQKVIGEKPAIGKKDGEVEGANCNKKKKSGETVEEESIDPESGT